MSNNKRQTLLHGLMLAASAVHGQTARPDVLDLSLEELMNVVVTSVSRKAQTLADTAAAAYVIQAEDMGGHSGIARET